MKRDDCPECHSKNISFEWGFAAEKIPGQPPQPGHEVPNQCRDCEHKWFDKD